jgi:riboflavin synthase
MKEGNSLRLRIRVPEAASRYVVQKGSIAIDGISLTVNEYRGGEIHLTLVPHTLEKTTLVDKKIGEEVNVEVDILGKYIEKVLERVGEKSNRINLSFLREHGFIEPE